MEPPNIGAVITIGDPTALGETTSTAIVKRAGKHFDGRLWANVWHLDDGYVPVMSVIEWDGGHWRFEHRAFEKMHHSVRATIEFQIAMDRKFRPKA